MNNSTIDLLKPRYEVVADYPKSDFAVGEIILLKDNKNGVPVYVKAEFDGVDFIDVSFFNDFPHIFKKLKWWERRKDEEMPQYLKLTMAGKIQYCHKVEKIMDLNDNGEPLYEYLNKAGYPCTGCINNLYPATIEEYEAYQSTLIK